MPNKLHAVKLCLPFFLIWALVVPSTPASGAIINLVQNGGFETLSSPTVGIGAAGGYICQKPSSGVTGTCISNLAQWTSTCQGTTCGTSGTVASIIFANTTASAFNGGIGLTPTGNSTAQFNSRVDANGVRQTVKSGVTGGNFLAIDGDTTYNASISQTIGGLTIGQAYVLQFWQAAAQQNGTTGVQTEKWQVTFGGQTLTSTVMNNPTGGFQDWNQQTMIFTATAVSQALTFLALGTPNGGPPVVLLDGVTLVTPEPGTFALFGGGMLALLAVKKKR